MNESREENFGSLAWIAPDVGVLTFVVWDVHPDYGCRILFATARTRSSQAAEALGGPRRD